MDDMPPRRSRRPQNKRSADSTFPLIPFFIGVVVLGFVIGAGISMTGRHAGSSSDVATSVSPVAATQSPTFAPATLAPLATPRPIASPSAARDDATPSPGAPSPSPLASGHRVASPAPSASPSTFAPVARATQAASPRATAPVAIVTHSPSTLLASPVTPAPLHSRAAAPTSPAPTPAASAEAPATSVPVTTVDADSDFGRLSANVVRQYLRALGRGDTASAGAALDSGSSSASFPEQAAMQAPGQIENIQARGNNQTQYVTADIDTPTGKYYATFAVHRASTGAAVIATHSISKE